MIFSGMVQAHVVSEVPHFYILQDAEGEDAGEKVHAYACFSESIPSIDTSVNPTRGMATLGMDCPTVVEVDRDALNQFVINLTNEKKEEASQEEKEECASFSLCAQVALGGTVAFGSFVVGLFSGIELFDHYKLGSKIGERPSLFSSVRKTKIAAVSALSVFVLSTLLAANAENASERLLSQNNESTPDDLLDEIRSGLIAGSDENGREVLRELTDFFNHHGTPVEL